MKRNNKKRLLVTLLFIAVMVSSSLSAGAVVRKTVKKQTQTNVTRVAKRKATTVKKGTTHLTFTRGEGYLRFVVPKTKTYTFTFSNVKTKLEDNATTSAAVMPFLAGPSTYKGKDKKVLYSLSVKTQGGKNWLLNLAVNGNKDTYNKKIDKYLKSRYATKKLKKGDVVYFYYKTYSKTKTTLKLVIK